MIRLQEVIIYGRNNCRRWGESWGDGGFEYYIGPVSGETGGGF